MDIEKLNQAIQESQTTGQEFLPQINIANELAKQTRAELKGQLEQKKQEVGEQLGGALSVGLLQAGGIPLIKGILKQNTGLTDEELDTLGEGDLGSVLVNRIKQGVSKATTDEDVGETTDEGIQASEELTSFKNPLFEYPRSAQATTDTQEAIMEQDPEDLNIYGGNLNLGEESNQLFLTQAPSQEEALAQIRSRPQQPIQNEDIPQGAGERVGDAEELKNTMDESQETGKQVGVEELTDSGEVVGKQAAVEGGEIAADVGEGLDEAAEASVIDDWNPVGLAITAGLGLAGLGLSLFGGKIFGKKKHKQNLPQTHLQPVFAQKTQASAQFL